LEAETAELIPAERDLERYRQFVRMAGEAARAVALAPAGTNPIAVAQKVLAISAQEKLAKRSVATGAAGRSATAGGAFLTKPVKANQVAPRNAEAGNPGADRGSCSRCGQVSGNCSCGAISRSGHWMRHGSSIVVVNC
jgi:hypothetical protein